MPTKTQKKQKNGQLYFRRWMMPVLVALLVTTLFVYGVVLCFLLKRQPAYDGQQIGTMIIKAVEGMNRPLPIDAPSGRVYLAAAKLSLPPVPLDLGEVVYSYVPAEDGGIDEVHLASLHDIRSSESSIMNSYSAVNNESTKAVFDHVPKLQACARGIAIKFQLTENDKSVATKKLANGKTVHFYTEPQCHNPELLEYAQQVTSY
jgi:hypothetical protein